MTENLIVELVRQGGFAILCAVMFWVYRSDSRTWAVKQSESASAFMAFGERTAESMTRLSETLRQQSEVLRQIEEQLSRNHMCPVTQVTSEMLRETVRGDGPQRRRVDAILRAASGAAASEAER